SIMRSETASTRTSATSTRLAAALAVLLALAGNTLAAGNPALAGIRELRLGLVVSESTVGGRAAADARRNALLEFAEKRLGEAGVRVTRNAVPYLIIQLTSPDLCDGSGKSGPAVSLSAELLDNVTVTRAAGSVQTMA